MQKPGARRRNKESESQELKKGARNRNQIQDTQNFVWRSYQSQGRAFPARCCARGEACLTWKPRRALRCHGGASSRRYVRSTSPSTWRPDVDVPSASFSSGRRNCSISIVVQTRKHAPRFCTSVESNLHKLGFHGSSVFSSNSPNAASTFASPSPKNALEASGSMSSGTAHAHSLAVSRC